MKLRPNSLLFTVLFGVLGGIPPLSIDVILPGLPRVQSDLSATPSQTSATLSLFLIGYGLSQIVIGPLSDRIGRLPIMRIGLLLYSLASAACAFAPSMPFLLAARFVQGIGAAGGTAIAFAVIRDLFEGEAARQRLATVAMVFSLAPVVAPQLGSLMLLLIGWRSIFLLLAAIGLGLAATVSFGLAETRRPGPALSYVGIFREWRSVGYSIVGGLSMGGIFAFVACSPLVMMGSMSLSATQFGFVFGCITFAIVIGSWVNSRLVRRGIRPTRPLGAALSVAALAASLGAVLAFQGQIGLTGLILVTSVTAFCRGIISPNITHSALERVPYMAGAASSMLGSFQILISATSGILVGLAFAAYGPAGMFATMAAFAVPALAMWVLVERST